MSSYRALRRAIMYIGALFVSLGRFASASQPDPQTAIVTGIKKAIHENALALQSMSCTVYTSRRGFGDDASLVSTWVSKGGRVIYKSRLANGTFFDAYYYDGENGFSVQPDVMSHGNKIDEASLEPSHRPIGQFTPRRFSFGVGTQSLEDAINEGTCKYLGQSSEPEFGTLYNFTTVVNEKTWTLSLAKAVHFMLVRAVTKSPRTTTTYECHDFKNINGVYAPQTAKYTHADDKGQVATMDFRFENICVNTVSDDNSTWHFPIGSTKYDGQRNIMYKLAQSGQWVPKQLSGSPSAVENTKRPPIMLWLLITSICASIILYFVRKRYAGS